MGSINIVGFDPSFRNWGVVQGTLDTETLEYSITYMNTLSTERQSAGAKIRQSSDDLFCARLLMEGVFNAIEKAHVVFAEVPVGSQSAAAMKGYGVCIGVLSVIDIPFIEVTPIDLKKHIGGTKSTSKDFIMNWAFSKFPNADWKLKKRKGVMCPTKSGNEHVCDAIGAIDTGIQTQQFKDIINILKMRG